MRAENLHLQEDAAATAARLPARHLETTYRGTVLDYRLELADGQRVTATTTRRLAVDAGAALEIRVQPRDLVLLED